MRRTPILLLAAIALAALLLGAAWLAARRARTKAVRFRGGAVVFRLPVDWTEGEDHGLGRYAPRGRPGVLRLEVIAAGAPTATAVETLDLLAARSSAADAVYERLEGGAVLETRDLEGAPKGIPLATRRWVLAKPLAAGGARLAVFSYTVERALLYAPETRVDLSRIDAAVHQAEIAEAPPR